MAKPTGKEMVQIFKEEKHPIPLAEQMEHFVNSFTADLEGFVEALKEEAECLKVQFSTISLLWVRKMNSFRENEWYDLRNERSIETCEKIQRLLGEAFKAFYSEYTGEVDPFGTEKLSFEVSFVEQMARSHRTLQQTFSELVFRWLSEMEHSMDDTFFLSSFR